MHASTHMFILYIVGISQVPHIEFTWGTNWSDQVEESAVKYKRSVDEYKFEYIIASDILLYVRYAASFVYFVIYMRIYTLYSCPLLSFPTCIHYILYSTALI